MVNTGSLQIQLNIFWVNFKEKFKEISEDFHRHLFSIERLLR